MEKLDVIFAKTLKVLLEQKNKTQRDLADYLGVSETAVSKWVSGGSMPRMDKIDAICEYLGVSRYEIFGMSPAEFEADRREYLLRTLAAQEGISIKALEKAIEFARNLSEQ